MGNKNSVIKTSEKTYVMDITDNGWITTIRKHNPKHRFVSVVGYISHKDGYTEVNVSIDTLKRILILDIEEEERKESF